MKQIKQIFFGRWESDFKNIGHRAIQELPGPILTGAVGNLHVKPNFGIYQVKLPLHKGKDATFRGICLDEITTKFPKYPM